MRVQEASENARQHAIGDSAEKLQEVKGQLAKQFQEQHSRVELEVATARAEAVEKAGSLRIDMQRLRAQMEERITGARSAEAARVADAERMANERVQEALNRSRAQTEERIKAAEEREKKRCEEVQKTADQKIVDAKKNSEKKITELRKRADDKIKGAKICFLWLYFSLLLISLLRTSSCREMTHAPLHNGLFVTCVFSLCVSVSVLQKSPKI